MLALDKHIAWLSCRIRAVFRNRLEKNRMLKYLQNRHSEHSNADGQRSLEQSSTSSNDYNEKTKITKKKRTELVVQQGSLMHKLADKIESIHTGYRPTIWCYGAAINTAVLAVIQKVLPHDYHREILKTQDGGLLAVDWANINSSDKKMVVLVLPGLTGSSKENYVTHLVEKAGKILA